MTAAKTPWTAWLIGACLAVSAQATVVEFRGLAAEPRLSADTGNADLAAGAEALQKGDADKAILSARRVIRRSPGNSRAHLLLLLGWVARGDFPAINQYLQDTQRTTPILAMPLREAVVAALMLQQRWYRASNIIAGIPLAEQTDQLRFFHFAALAEQNQIAAAVDGMKSLAQRMPNSIDLQFNLARLAMVRQDFSIADRAATKLLVQLPEDPQGLSLLLTAQLQQQHYPESIRTANRWLKKDPNNTYATFVKGVAEFCGGQTAAALVSFRRANALKTDMPDARLGMAAAYMLLGQWTESAAAAEQALALAPADGLAPLFLAAARLAGADSAGAQTALRRSVELFADVRNAGAPLNALPELRDPQAALLLAHANFLHRFASPQSTLDRLGKSSISGPLIDLTRARAVRQSSDFKRALDLYTRLAQDHLWMDVAVLEKADTQYALGHEREAAMTYQALVSRGSALPGLRSRRADLLNSLGDHALAADIYRSQLKIAPADRYARNQLAATLRLIGGAARLQEALELTNGLLREQLGQSERDNVLDTQAGILLALGRQDMALASYRDLEKRNALRDAESWHHYGHLLLAANPRDRQHALRCIERALDSGAKYATRDDDVRLLTTG